MRIEDLERAMHEVITLAYETISMFLDKLTTALSAVRKRAARSSSASLQFRGRQGTVLFRVSGTR